MKCDHCQELFTRHLDGELEGEKEAFISHLASCSHCAADFRLFEQMVTSLHGLPQSKAPADLLPGIHEKLAQPSLGKIRQFLALMGQHKFAASTALATMMIAVISATVLQLNTVVAPQADRDVVAMQQGGQVVQQASLTTPSRPNHNYYPGVPYLARRPDVAAPASMPQASVQFASTGQPYGAYVTSQTGRAPPAFASLAPSSYAPFSVDVTLAVHPTNTAHQHALIRQLVKESVWLPQMQGNTMFIKMPASRLASLQRLFSPADLHLCQADLAKVVSLQQDNRLLNIAVTFQ